MYCSCQGRGYREGLGNVKMVMNSGKECLL